MDNDAYKEMFHGWIAKAAEYKIALGIAAVCTVIIIISLIWPKPKPVAPISEVQTTPPASNHVFTVPASPSPAPTTNQPSPAPTTNQPSPAPTTNQPSPTPSPIEKELSAKPLFPTPAASTPAASTPAASTPAASTPAASTPASRPSSPSSNITDLAPSGYFIQVGSFRDKQRAITLAGKLQNKKWPTLIVPRPNHLNGVWIGPYKTIKVADKAKLELKKSTGVSGFVYKNH